MSANRSSSSGSSRSRESFRRRLRRGQKGEHRSPSLLAPSPQKRDHIRRKEGEENEESWSTHTVLKTESISKHRAGLWFVCAMKLRMLTLLLLVLAWSSLPSASGDHFQYGSITFEQVTISPWLCSAGRLMFRV